MAFCGNCGSQIEPRDNFCPVCGFSLKDTNGDIGRSSKESFNDAADQYHPEDIRSTKAVSVLAYFGILFFVPLAARPESKFGRFHSNQGLLLLITNIILEFIAIILSIVLVFIFRGETVWSGFYSGGYSLNMLRIALIAFVWLAVYSFSLVFLILGIVNAAGGKAKELPIIGRFRLIK